MHACYLAYSLLRCSACCHYTKDGRLKSGLPKLRHCVPGQPASKAGRVVKIRSMHELIALIKFKTM